MAKIDEVSQILGNLDAKVDNISESIQKIEKHLDEINGAVDKHQMKMSACDEKFAKIEKEVGSVKWDYKFWGAISGLVIIVTVALKALGI